ncbi:regulatory protein RecX [Leifsonia sp. SIMBA_070]|uniref:regulatory protein RecX n=1 Tax=Leifsonia sp. SIMBA_070 TaxID=3085810 RepID=UPI003977FFFB
MVRFADSSGDGAAEGERLAPVTPLRRPAADRGRGGEDHPSRRGAGMTGTAKAATAKTGTPKAGTPKAGTAKPAAVLPVVTDGGWNNTWGAERQTAASLPDEVDEEAARQTRKTSGLAIRQLARRGMSRWELEQVLTRREIEPEVYGPELDRLEALGVIDDASLAVSLAFTQHSRKGLGRTAIEQELKRRHVAPELIEAALADIGQDDELERATELAVKRMGQLSTYDDETARRRLHGFLARKGYASDIVRQAMDAAFAGRRSRGGSGVRFQ